MRKSRLPRLKTQISAFTNLELFPIFRWLRPSKGWDHY